MGFAEKFIIKLTLLILMVLACIVFLLMYEKIFNEDKNFQPDLNNFSINHKKT